MEKEKKTVTVEPYGFTSQLELSDIRFREVRETPFDIYGLSYEKEGLFYRLPEDVATATNPGVLAHRTHTAGGRVRFCTDSAYVAIHARLPYMYRATHFPLSGAAGFDLYIKEGARYYYYGTLRPGVNCSGEYEAVLHLPGRKMRQMMIHFPLYSRVDQLHIGLQQDAAVDHGERYRYDKPVVYYGSSITQGGCASRPGNAYQAIISRNYDCDFLNLGFSGNAKGESAIRDYIASLDMSVCVLDYDHNAPNPEHLRATHEPLYRAIRQAHPDLPIVFITAPGTQWYFHHDAATATRHERHRQVIFETYSKALAEGDRNVRYIDGETLFAGPNSDLCTVDGTHPNDAGFLRMAEKIGAVVSSLLR